MRTTSPQRVRRALTESQMSAVTAAVQAADSGPAVLAVVVREVFGPLLETLGESLADYGPQRRLDPGRFEIPSAQWQAISAACLGRADAFGTKALVALDLADLMPGSYEDPHVMARPAPRVDQRPAALVLRVTREAVDVIAAATAHCERLRAWFGDGSREHLVAAESWQRALAGLFGFGFGAQTRVSRDGDLSLFAQTDSGYVYGIVFHPTRRRCTREGCHALIGDDGTARPQTRRGALCPEGRHTPSYPLDAPTPGSWSLHS